MGNFQVTKKFPANTILTEDHPNSFNEKILNLGYYLQISLGKNYDQTAIFVKTTSPISVG